MTIRFLAGICVIAVGFGVRALAQEHQGASQADPTAVPDVKPDPRLHTRTLHNGSGFKSHTDKQAWLDRAKYLREQVLMAAGLYPLPEKCDLKPVIHGKTDRGDYTVEKVFFQSYPGFFVSGNLYRPKGKTGPFPAILSPHGHWENGRLYRNNDRGVKSQIAGGWEKDELAARYPLQARAANLAKLGCIVFFYDMVGYADSDPQHFPHRSTYADIDSENRLINIFGLQTWDSIRALDFLLSLPDVDKTRIGCTGASGGGTQTFIMMTVDDRLTAAAPVCMISHDEHQGGCVCENAPLLRMFTDNVEFAATFAPRPFIHPTCTGDWTAQFMEHGLPEIKATYALFGVENNVEAMRQKADHNYNLISREAVYNFFNARFKLGAQSPVHEQKFEPIEPKDLAVFDDQHPRPADAVDAPTLKKYLIAEAQKQLDALRPTDAASLAKFREVIGTALRHMTSTQLPGAGETVTHKVGTEKLGDISIEKLMLSRRNSPEQLPAVLLVPPNPNGKVTIVVIGGPSAKRLLVQRSGEIDPGASDLLKSGQMVLGVDVFLSGQLVSSNPTTQPNIEFYTGYNRSILANRVHDILTAIACMKAREGVSSVNLVGISKEGPWCLLAKALAGDAVAKTVVEADKFDFDQVTDFGTEYRLPGALRYGGLWTLAALAAPGDLLVYNVGGRAEATEPLQRAYNAAGAKDKLRIESDLNPDQALQFLR